MQTEKGKMKMGPKSAYVKRRNLRRVYNPKAAQPSKTPQPVDNIASTSASVPENNDDFVKFPKPSIRRGGAIQKWIERLNQKKTPAQEVVLQKSFCFSVGGSGRDPTGVF
ncbi:hypothetical protein LIER_28294 [Lithospermum erythrorhizon]|uniref:Uncharacterized protein n=1 Tax=Lithospermum erythrorhizon TaxID=34254 RepID=A0AAV3RGS0_LITER